MANNLDQIIDCLDQLLETEVRQRGATLGNREDEPGCLFLSSGTALYAETLGDSPEANAACLPVRTDRLTNLGWNPPLPGDDHWYRSWHVEAEIERRSAAVQIQRTLDEAYGIGANEALSIRFAPN